MDPYLLLIPATGVLLIVNEIIKQAYKNKRLARMHYLFFSRAILVSVPIWLFGLFYIDFTRSLEVFWLFFALTGIVVSGASLLEYTYKNVFVTLGLLIVLILYSGMFGSIDHNINNYEGLAGFNFVMITGPLLLLPIVQYIYLVFESNQKLSKQT